MGGVFPLAVEESPEKLKKDSRSPALAPALGILVPQRQEGPCLCVWDKLPRRFSRLGTQRATGVDHPSHK